MRRISTCAGMRSYRISRPSSQWPTAPTRPTRTSSTGRFFERYVGSGNADIPKLPYVTEHLEARLWTTQGRRAVLIVDALRYDCAHLVRQALPNLDVKLEPMRAALPTITPVGMTALLPLSATEVSFDVKGNGLHTAGSTGRTPRPAARASRSCRRSARTAGRNRRSRSAREPAGCARRSARRLRP